MRNQSLLQLFSISNALGEHVWTAFIVYSLEGHFNSVMVGGVSLEVIHANVLPDLLH